jgi:hypothetical protein
MLGRPGNKAIDYSEVTAVLWKVLQETVKEGAELRTRVATLESQMSQTQTVVQNLLLRVKALEAK